jgi:hypothetical protein
MHSAVAVLGGKELCRRLGFVAVQSRGVRSDPFTNAVQGGQKPGGVAEGIYGSNSSALRGSVRGCWLTLWRAMEDRR